jgi:cyclic-di-AMP phosphodiesterase PgpH
VKKIISFIRHSHPEIYKGILFSLALVAIVYIFPKQGKFKYEFQSLKGKPWYYEDLIAPFDFAIKKTDEELKKEKAEVIQNASPYLKYNNDIAKNKKIVFELSLNNSWNNKNSQYLKQKTLAFGKAIIDSIYEKGIIEPVDELEDKPSDYTVFVLHNNIAEEHELGDFYTVKSAYEFIQNKLDRSTIVDKQAILPLLENAIAHNIFYDKVTTAKVLNQAIDNISPSRDIILKDQRILSKGEIVDSQKYQILVSLKAEYEEESSGTGNYLFIILGQIMIISICLGVLAAFLKFFRKDIYLDNAKVTFILILVVLQVLMAHFSLNRQSVIIYIFPFCILPIIIRAFYDTRVALFVHLVTVLIISFIAPKSFEFAFIQLLGGMVAIFSIVNMRNRSQIFISAILIFLTYAISFTGITIVQEGNNELKSLDYAWFGVSSLLTLFSYPLIFVFEKIFGFTSDVSLLELSDTNGKLLRELASRAPGTFQHSLQVANLAEEAIYKIGGNSLLVRTGALYHDIGKMEMPMYFIENQAGGINPHDDLSFDESASIIISHVIKGIEIAKKNNLPEQIIDFIRTHHGTTMTAYFYRSFLKAFPEEAIDENKFHYPGPIPYSKETAVLMMADSVEAASRSLKKYDVETIDALVDKIINSQISQNQFVNADITFKDINILKKIFKKKLMNIYHVRVEYPR